MYFLDVKRLLLPYVQPTLLAFGVEDGHVTPIMLPS